MIRSISTAEAKFFGPFQERAVQPQWQTLSCSIGRLGLPHERMLLDAASESGVNAGSLSIKEGVISGGGKSAPLADFVAAAAQLSAPENPKLKDAADFQLIGNPSVRRLDSKIKTDGSAQFAMDVYLPNQMIAMITRPEQRGGLATGF